MANCVFPAGLVFLDSEMDSFAHLPPLHERGLPLIKPPSFPPDPQPVLRTGPDACNCAPIIREGPAALTLFLPMRNAYT